MGLSIIGTCFCGPVRENLRIIGTYLSEMAKNGLKLSTMVEENFFNIFSQLITLDFKIFFWMEITFFPDFPEKN